MVENLTAFSEMIRPISRSVRGLMGLFPRAWSSIVVDRLTGLAENAELLIHFARISDPSSIGLQIRIRKITTRNCSQFLECVPFPFISPRLQRGVAGHGLPTEVMTPCKRNVPLPIALAIHHFFAPW
jgi:hypothetical protein